MITGSRLLLCALLVAGLTACRGQTSRETPLFGIRNMYDQPKYTVQNESNFFPDHRTMRPLVEGVIAHDEDVDPQIARGRLDDESGYVLTIPTQVVTRMGGMEALVTRGKQRFGIYCAPCHDNTGGGEGLVKRRAQASGAAAFAPTNMHQDRIRHMPDGQLFATITNGKSNMPPYGMQIKVDDRWAIVSYVRALQIAQPHMASQGPAMPTAAPGGTTAPAPGGTTAGQLEKLPLPVPSASSAPSAPSAAPEEKKP